jgi:hypothetical protein
MGKDGTDLLIIPFLTGGGGEPLPPKDGLSTTASALLFPGGSGPRFPDDGGNYAGAIIWESLRQAFDGPRMPEQLTDNFTTAVGLVGYNWQTGAGGDMASG